MHRRQKGHTAVGSHSHGADILRRRNLVHSNHLRIHSPQQHGDPFGLFGSGKYVCVRPHIELRTAAPGGSYLSALIHHCHAESRMRLRSF